mmetsp:Transcript_24523/g.39311  ORF Transcript_24523/g.39311 Transcript_24523/m.39311 type:complete len:229 (-) Transcript_24523:863-1549(-)
MLRPSTSLTHLPRISHSHWNCTEEPSVGETRNLGSSSFGAALGFVSSVGSFAALISSASRIASATLFSSLFGRRRVRPERWRSDSEPRTFASRSVSAGRLLASRSISEGRLKAVEELTNGSASSARPSRLAIVLGKACSLEACCPLARGCRNAEVFCLVGSCLARAGCTCALAIVDSRAASTEMRLVHSSSLESTSANTAAISTARRTRSATQCVMTSSNILQSLKAW